MAAEDTRRSELAEFMTHHVLSNIDGDKLIAIMHSNGLANKIRRNHRGS